MNKLIDAVRTDIINRVVSEGVNLDGVIGLTLDFTTGNAEPKLEVARALMHDTAPITVTINHVVPHNERN